MNAKPATRRSGPAKPKKPVHVLVVQAKSTEDHRSEEALYLNGELVTWDSRISVDYITSCVPILEPINLAAVTMNLPRPIQWPKNACALLPHMVAELEAQS